MEFREGQEIHGFRVTRNAACAELNGKTVYLTHERTGARLFWLNNGAENKTFAIAFRTLPEDDTGVFHILEHSVLCGSRKYPVKEPFVELMKSSMNTFLNAMTFPDMTMYPVSSRNSRDLLNLVSVYLDAVFAPAVMDQELIFRQEGWHIETGEDGQPVYQGVVYNEMKGAMSDTDSLIDYQIVRQLFPDTSYGFTSGGDPEHIPDLTFDQFQRQYRRCYHPSNALIYLDGEVPMPEILALLDEYLAPFERREDLPAFRWQRPAASERTIEYELQPGEPAENRSHLALAAILGDWRNREENLARSIAADVLTGSNEAPLKRAVLERGLAQDFTISVDDTSLQSWVTFYADNVTDGREDEIPELLKETAEKIRREGLDREAVEASLNRAAFHMREEDEPQGIGRCIRAVGFWLFGGDPAEALCSEALIRQVRDMVKTGELDRLAAEMLENREGLAVLHALPSRAVGEEKRAAEARKLRRITEAWTAEERARNDRLLEALEAWQTEPDSPEAIACLPRLTRKDADTAPAWIPTEKTEVNGVPVWMHQLPCNGVVHLRVYIRLTDLSLEQLTAAAFAAGLLGKLPTRSHDALKLQHAIRRATGYFGFYLAPQAAFDERKTCTPYLIGFTGALKENAKEAAELLVEVLTTTCFDAEDKILEMAQQVELAVRQRLASSGQQIATRHVLAHFSADGAVKNAIEGVPAIRYIHHFSAHPSEALPALRALAEQIRDRNCRRSNMLLSVTSDGPFDPAPMLETIPEGKPVPASAAYRVNLPEKAGFRIPGQTGFMARGYRISNAGYAFSGALWLATGILSLDYLWNRIRVRGGAYGAGIHVDRSGTMSSWTFRDPTPGKSLKADAGAAAFLRKFTRQEESLDRYIISALNEMNPLLSPRDQGAIADARLLAGVKRENLEQIRLQVLNATMQDLRDCAACLDAYAREGAVCVVAPQNLLKACGALEIEEL